jgi:hypothetical protein
VRGPEALEALEVRGSRVASLRGLERMASLEVLLLRDVAMSEIDLRGLGALRVLIIEVAPGPMTLTGSDGLVRLEQVALTGAIVDDATARTLLALPALRQAFLTHLMTAEDGSAVDVVARGPDGWRFQTDANWAWGIRRWDAVASAARAAAAGLNGSLECSGTAVCFTAADRGTVEAFRDAVDAITRERGGPEPGTLPSAPRLGTIREPDDRRAVLTLDLAGLLGSETNYAAERRLRAALPAELAARLDWDTEAGEVVVLATAVEDLEAVQRVIASLAS